MREVGDPEHLPVEPSRGVPERPVRGRREASPETRADLFRRFAPDDQRILPLQDEHPFGHQGTKGFVDLPRIADRPGDGEVEAGEYRVPALQLAQGGIHLGYAQVLAPPARDADDRRDDVSDFRNPCRHPDVPSSRNWRFEQINKQTPYLPVNA